MEDEFDNVTWDDIHDYWNGCTKEQRLEYIVECLHCDKDDRIAQVIADSDWDVIPDPIQELLEGWSQLGNDVFDVVNGWE